MTAEDPIVSVIHGNNADLIAEVARLYMPDGSVVADVTWGKGAFWRKYDLSRISMNASDIDQALDPDMIGVDFVAADFTALPYDDESFHVVVLDPPYIHSPGQHMTDKRYNNAATTKGMYHDDIMDLYRRGMAEAKRVLKPDGTIWVKCKDQVMSGKQQWSHIDLYRIGEGLNLYMRDLFVLIPTSRTSMGRWKVQHHARKVHSYLLVFQIEKEKNA